MNIWQHAHTQKAQKKKPRHCGQHNIRSHVIEGIVAPNVVELELFQFWQVVAHFLHIRPGQTTAKSPRYVQAAD